jgi:hypothetical protein
MNFDIDEAKILYGLGALFGIGALLYFARDLVFDLSVTVKSLLLLLGFVAFFAAANATERPTLDTVLYVLSGGAYVVFLGYMTDQYDVGETGIFLTLAASSMLFIGLGYLLRERERRLSLRQARYVLVGVAVLASLLVLIDLLGGGIVYTATLESQVTMGEEPQAVVGTVVAQNEFVAARTVSSPSVDACVYALDRREAHARLEAPDQYRYGGPRVLGGGDEFEMEIKVRYERPENTTGTAREFAVERAPECPDESSVTDPTIVVVLDESVKRA